MTQTMHLVAKQNARRFIQTCSSQLETSMVVYGDLSQCESSTIITSESPIGTVGAGDNRQQHDLKHCNITLKIAVKLPTTHPCLSLSVSFFSSKKKLRDTNSTEHQHFVNSLK